MDANQQRVEAIFGAALELSSPEQRERYLAKICGGDLALRHEVEELLQAFIQAGGFLTFKTDRPESDASADQDGVRPPPGAAEKIGDRIGHYKLLEPLGEGGCGVVYVAEQEEPVRRRVALKVIKPGMDTRSVIARFEAERQALALMDHPNIAQVFEAGTTEAGRPFFVMELVRGMRITDYCDQNALSARERLDLFIQVCRAIQHAHQKGIIHRDIKPSNILVTLQDGGPVPKVIDFGIAKATLSQRLTDKTVYTAFAQCIGTPAYMSPEQAALSSLDLDTRSDIYALGVLLYELLTGRTPFDASQLLAAGLDEMRRIIREQEPPRPSTRLSTLVAHELLRTARQRHADPPKLIHLVRGDLDWIVMKCLEKDRTRRYETASGLAIDVERYLRHQPIHARPPSTAYRARKFIRRNKVMVAATGLVALGLVCGGAASVWQAIRATRAERAQSLLRQQAEANLRRAEQAQAHEAAQRRLAEQHYYCASLGQAQALIDQGQFGRASQILAQTNLAPLRGWEWGWLVRTCHLDLMTLGGGGMGLTGVAFSPDGRWLAVGSYDATVRVWNAATGAEPATWRGHSNVVVLLGFSPDSRRLVTASFDGTAKVWEVATGQAMLTLTGHTRGVWCAAFSPDGKTIATGSGDHTVRLWDAQQGALIKQVDNGGDEVLCLAFSPDARTLAFAGGSGSTWTRSADNSVRLLDLASGEIRALTGHTHGVSGIAFHPDGHRLATASWDGTARLGDVRTETQLQLLFGLRSLGGLLTVAFSPDGRWCVVAGGAMGPQKAEAGVHLIELATRQVAQVFEGHARMVRGVAVSPDGSRIASTSLDGTLKLWPVTAPPTFTSLEGHDQAVWTLAVSPNDQYVATGSLDQTARIWELETGRLLRTVPVGFPVVSLAFTPEGNRLLTVGGHGTAQLWDPRLDLTPTPTHATPPTPELLRVFTGHSDSVFCVACSSHGRYFATGSRDQSARIWEAQSGRVAHVLEGHTQGVLAVAFSPDETRIATASADRTARIWEVATARRLLTLAGHADQVLQVAWSPDGQLLATGGQDGAIGLWDARTGALQWPFLAGHRDGVSALVFSPDGRRLASAGGGLAVAKAHTLDNSVFLWDVATGQSVFRLRPHFNVVRALAQSADGTRLITGSVDNTARIYRAFAWSSTDAPGAASASFAERFERDKRDYWARLIALAPTLTSPRPGRRLETRIFEFNVAVDGRPKTSPARPIPARDPAAGPDHLNLAPVYNAALDEAWLPTASLDDLDLDLSALPVGLHTLGKVSFDVRGLLQLRRHDPDWSRFPEQVRIPVGRGFRRFHALQGTVRNEVDGVIIGRYRLRYADGQILDQAIQCGRDVRDWQDRSAPTSLGEGAAVAWTGPRWAGASPSESVRLYRTTYVNPRPEAEVVSIDFLSTLSRTAPFLVAMTVD